MGKIIRLTERDLTRLVKQVIEEQSKLPMKVYQVYNTYHWMWPDFSGTKMDNDVLEVQKILNKSGDIGPGKKYPFIKENGIIDREMYDHLERYIRQRDPEFEKTKSMIHYNIKPKPYKP
jgi:hypothetical protein